MAKSTSTKIIDIAKANIKAKDEDKAIAQVERNVRDNKYNWDGEIVSAQRDVESAQDALDALHGDVSATAATMLNAKRVVTLAQKNAEAIQELYDARF